MLAPIIVCLCSLVGGNAITLTQVFENDFSIGANNFIYDSINDIFGVNGQFPLYGADSLLPYFLTYWGTIILLQLVYDTIFFIPKIAHKWIHQITQDEE